MKYVLLLLVLFLSSGRAISQSEEVVNVSMVHPDIYFDEKESVQFILLEGDTIYEVQIPPRYSLEQMLNSPVGIRSGIFFDFKDETFKGKLAYGFIPVGDSKYPHPVYFRSTAQINQGRVAINIAQIMKGTYDMIGWEESGKGTLGYRVIAEDGRFLYDGKVTFKGTGPFEVDVTVVEGPFINILKSDGATISFETNLPSQCEILVDNKNFKDTSTEKHHEIVISGLNSDTEYDYTVRYGNNEETYRFRTAPDEGSRSKFIFGYASDSRSGNGGGERDLYGANLYIMKKIMALSRYVDVRFLQFTGDMINGYLTSEGDMNLQYANWKRAIEPFARYFPVYAAMGNHEAFMRMFKAENATFMIDKYPYEDESAEAMFGKHFVNPLNGPESEDGASYDPNPSVIDFPTYKENVFYYTYDNIAVVCMNSDYWYSPSTATIPLIGGGLHGYIMDNQLDWIKQTIKSLEKNENIDHIFITEHTPFFPNGGHVRDDMWYNGDNYFRPYVAGKPLDKGIIERRDQLLEIIVNESEKVVAILTGDEHNYCKTEIGPDTRKYPDDWNGKKLKLNRTIYQINNGAAGAPYYAQEQTPWTPFTSGFTTQNALVLFHVEGTSLKVEVRNPDTLELVDEYTLRE